MTDTTTNVPMTIEQQAQKWYDEHDCDDAVGALAAFVRHLSSQAPGNLSEEVRKIDEMLHFTAHKLTPSEAVKWLHDLYTEQCVTLQECAQRHKIGLGGEKLAKVVADAVDELTAARDHYLSGWVATEAQQPTAEDAVDGLVFVLNAQGVPGVTLLPVTAGWTHWKSPRPLPIPPYTPQQEQR